jgi:hypothetical protein
MPPICSAREETVHRKEEGRKEKDTCDRQPACVDRYSQLPSVR